MAEVRETVVAAAPCFDPECGGLAEPDQADDVTFLVCQECGSEFGHQRLAEAQDGDCQLGIPESVRRGSAVPPPAPTPVTLGRKR